MKCRGRSIFALAVALLTPLCASAQEEKPFTISVSVGYVLVPFTVTDRRGRIVSTLRERDVELFVDGKAVVIDSMQRTQDAPLSLTLLLDGSGSMALHGKREAARAAIQTLLSRGREGDEYALSVFSTGKATAVAFTRHRGKILDEVDRMVPFGRTAFYDALMELPERAIEGANAARAIILFTDGLDNASVAAREQLLEALLGLEVPIYAFQLSDSQLRLDQKTATDSDLLEQICRSSGGRFIRSTAPSQVAAAAAAISSDLRTQYVVGFTTSGRGDVKYRPISIRLAKRSLRIHGRAGYRGTEPPVRLSKAQR